MKERERVYGKRNLLIMTLLLCMSDYLWSYCRTRTMSAYACPMTSHVVTVRSTSEKSVYTVSYQVVFAVFLHCRFVKLWLEQLHTL
jgi:hypothetical protein